MSIVYEYFDNALHEDELHLNLFESDYISFYSNNKNNFIVLEVDYELNELKVFIYYSNGLNLERYEFIVEDDFLVEFLSRFINNDNLYLSKYSLMYYFLNEVLLIFYEIDCNEEKIKIRIME